MARLKELEEENRHFSIANIFLYQYRILKEAPKTKIPSNFSFLVSCIRF